MPEPVDGGRGTGAALIASVPKGYGDAASFNFEAEFFAAAGEDLQDFLVGVEREVVDAHDNVCFDQADVAPETEGLDFRDALSVHDGRGNFFRRQLCFRQVVAGETWAGAPIGMRAYRDFTMMLRRGVVSFGGVARKSVAELAASQKISFRGFFIDRARRGPECAAIVVAGFSGAAVALLLEARE
jgi:hypothetical protein